MGLQRYAQVFQDYDIDAEVLRVLTAEDLIDLGVTSIGHRRKLLVAIAALPAEATARSCGDAEHRQLTIMFCDLDHMSA